MLTPGRARLGRKGRVDGEGAAGRGMMDWISVLRRAGACCHVRRL
jgi:hypothetical protein